ncbi:MAG: cyclic nucleotide-binding domain-containing protein [Gammaproteobacteria bacterium]|nr:cyclic nucleotide-binding domain-containing protein [Gammaproteobacteria bacterium]
MDKVETLQDTDLFGGLDAQVLGEIAEFCEPLHLADGGLLIAEGRPQTPDLYLVVEGEFDVITRHPAKPDERMTLGNLDYEVVGEIAWLTGATRSATVRCRGDLVALRIDGASLMSYLEEHRDTGFEVMRRMMRALAQKLIDANFFLM